MKKFSIGFIAIMMAAGLAAFTQPKKAEKKAFTYSYRYTESNNTNRTDPSKYTLSEDATGCVDSEDVICLINAPYAPDAFNHPTFPSGTDPMSNSLGVSVTKWKE